MVKLFPKTSKLREEVLKVLDKHGPSVERDGRSLESIVLDSFAKRTGWLGRTTSSFKMKYHLLAVSLTYWCKHSPHFSIRKWGTGGDYPVEMGFKYKLPKRKAKEFLHTYRDEVLYPYRTIHGVFNDPFFRDLYQCLYMNGVIRGTVITAYKSIRW